MVLANDSIHNIFKESDSLGLGLGANANVKALLDGSTVNTAGYVVIGSGTVLIATGQNSWGVSYADVNISGGAVDDLIIVEVQGLSHSQPIQYYLRLRNTTADLTADYVIYQEMAANINYNVTARLIQSPETNDVVIGTSESVESTTIACQSRSNDTNDANIFTTDFTLRLDFRHEPIPSDGASTVRYRVYKLPAT